MSYEKTNRRMPLRQLLTHSEKCARDLMEHLKVTLSTRLTEYRDLTRPTRRRSAFPTMLAMKNGLKKLNEAADEVLKVADYLEERLEEIREHARAERSNRRV